MLHDTYRAWLPNLVFFMTMQEQLLDAATLLLVGMSVVFVFLTLLIGAVNVIAWLNRLMPVETPAQPTFVASRAEAKTPDNTVAAISAAIHQYRSKHHN